MIGFIIASIVTAGIIKGTVDINSCGRRFAAVTKPAV